MVFEKFERIEEGINRLLEGYEGLKAENIELKDSIGAKDSEIEELREKLKRLDKEKALVKEKVETLLQKLDSLIQGA